MCFAIDGIDGAILTGIFQRGRIVKNRIDNLYFDVVIENL